ncbi:MAG TPA: response regulator transcription factor [Verrucomicrobiae bacterium]|jgi:DNA-binding NarL/FixJ family response regulator|nr:response regulator transcription factor [Verrucomicrobiae bacterium]
MKPLRILIADDHEMVRQGLRRVIAEQPGWLICGEVATGRQAVERAEATKPDVVVMDFAMPELNGMEATRQICAALPGTEVLILSMHESEELVREILAAGARGYVLKSDAGHSLVNAIKALAEHKPYFTSKISSLVLQGYLNPQTRESAALTPREREIVQLVAEGRSSKKVADVLGISVKTAETHRSNILRKLGLRSVSELVRYAIRNKIVEA